MPMIVITGIPSSGKSTRATQLAAFLRSNSKRPVCIITEHLFVDNRDAVYTCVAREKQSRCALKSELQRHLAAESWTIIDALNYVKGYRYELYCVAREARCAQLTLHCATDNHLAWQWNVARADTDGGDTYSRSVFYALVARYEPPCSERRWERPLLQLMPEESTPCQQIADMLTSASTPTPHQSTQPAVISSSTEDRQQVDKQLQLVVSELLQLQMTAVEGDRLTVGGAREPLLLRRKMTLAQWNRYRRQFMSFLLSRQEPAAPQLVPQLFVQYLNSVVTD